MSESIKISSLELENVKRVKAVKLEPSVNGLTVIGGKNNQGKTSILDAIAWALGGNKFKPSKPNREDSTLPPVINIRLSNGLVVERKGKKSDLKVTDPSGQKAGQNLLDSFVEEFALNLPKFMEQSSKEKANTLLQIIGVGDQLVKLEREETEKYNSRLAIGRIADQKEKFAKEQIFYPDAPKDLISASDLIKEQQDILARNGQRQQWRAEMDRISNQIILTQHAIATEEQKLRELNEKLIQLQNQDKEAQKTPEQMQMESTAELEKSIADIDAINDKVRANLSKDKAEDDAKDYRSQYDKLTLDIESIRKQKTALLDNADLPLPGLSVQDGDLIYKGQQWDNMSGSDQLKVSTAIVRKLNPQCGFVLLDKLEQMDLDTMNEFGKWLESEGLQAIATKVSTGEECSVIISDGYVEGAESSLPEPLKQMKAAASNVLPSKEEQLEPLKQMKEAVSATMAEPVVPKWKAGSF